MSDDEYLICCEFDEYDEDETYWNCDHCECNDDWYGCFDDDEDEEDVEIEELDENTFRDIPKKGGRK